MPRPAFTNPEDFLPNRETQSTVEILLRGESIPYLYSTNRVLNIASKGETEVLLLKVSELKETLGQATNRVGVVLSNINSGWSLKLADANRPLEFADVNVRRFYQKIGDLSITEHKHFFTGKAVGAESGEQTLSFDVITPETAAGTCIATETLTPANDWIFEYVAPSPPGSGGNDGGEGSGSCPRIDQLVLARDDGGNIRAIPAIEVKAGAMLWNPVVKEFHKVKSAEIVANQPIWKARTKNGAVGFCSSTHPLIRSISDTKGASVQSLKEKQKILTWFGGSFGDVKQSQLITVRDTGEFAPVVKIEMEKEHIYVFGDDTEFMLVCHNAMNKNGGTILT